MVAQLIELGCLDDAAFARAWIESRDRARPRGELALRRELGQKGVDRQVADDVLSTRTEGSDGEIELTAALRLLDRRRSALERESDPVKRRHKAYALLARNGFDPDTCRSATTRWLYPSG